MRRLASRLFEQEEIHRVGISDGGVEIATRGGQGVDAFLTGLGAEGLLDEVVALDDSLESGFGYLVK